MRKSEEMELQYLSAKKWLTAEELQRSRYLWCRYFDVKDREEKKK